eukprot:COSAG01_NODE_2522_length_7515_cov_12.042605_2_plen_225_part_00
MSVRPSPLQAPGFAATADEVESPWAQVSLGIGGTRAPFPQPRFDTGGTRPGSSMDPAQARAQQSNPPLTHFSGGGSSYPAAAGSASFQYGAGPAAYYTAPTQPPPQRQHSELRWQQQAGAAPAVEQQWRAPHDGRHQLPAPHGAGQWQQPGGGYPQPSMPSYQAPYQAPAGLMAARQLAPPQPHQQQPPPQQPAYVPARMSYWQGGGGVAAPVQPAQTLGNYEV